jgi:hypothetical protein
MIAGIGFSSVYSDYNFLAMPLLLLNILLIWGFSLSDVTPLIWNFSAFSVQGHLNSSLTSSQERLFASLPKQFCSQVKLHG